MSARAQSVRRQQRILERLETGAGTQHARHLGTGSFVGQLPEHNAGLPSLVRLPPLGLLGDIPLGRPDTAASPPLIRSWSTWV